MWVLSISFIPGECNHPETIYNIRYNNTYKVIKKLKTLGNKAI